MADSNAAALRRPRPLLLVVLAVSLAALVVYLLWPAAARPSGPSNPPREQRRQASATAGQNATLGPLDVRLEALREPRPAPEEAARNPFRFYVKPPPPPPPPPKPVVTPPPTQLHPGDPGYVPPAPPPPPPIPLKFIGTVEIKGRKVAIFTSSDGRGMPVHAGEGELVLGQYRVVKIGVESVTLEYLDGRGRQTIPMRGG